MGPGKKGTKKRLKAALAGKKVSEQFAKAKEKGQKVYAQKLAKEQASANKALSKKAKAYQEPGMKPNQAYKQHEAAVKSNVTNLMVSEQGKTYEPQIKGGTKKMIRQTKQNIRKSAASKQAKKAAYRSL